MSEYVLIGDGDFVLAVLKTALYVRRCPRNASGIAIVAWRIVRDTHIRHLIDDVRRRGRSMQDDGPVPYGGGFVVRDGKIWNSDLGCEDFATPVRDAIAHFNRE